MIPDVLIHQLAGDDVLNDLMWPEAHAGLLDRHSAQTNTVVHRRKVNLSHDVIRLGLVQLYEGSSRFLGSPDDLIGISHWQFSRDWQRNRDLSASELMKAVFRLVASSGPDDCRRESGFAFQPL